VQFRRAGPLKLAVAIAGLVTVAAGLAGVALGPQMAEGAPASWMQASVVQAGAIPAVSLDSHFRYLSGLLLGIGLAFWSLIPNVAARGTTFRLLTFIVFVGGLARLGGLVLAGVPSAPMLFGLVMELIITPLLCLWQARVAAADSNRVASVDRVARL
jgi:Domain of unknown function (DUF4345)